MGILERRQDPDRGRFRSVTGGVREQVVEHLHDPAAVGHRAGEVRGKVNDDAVAPAAADEGAPRPFHQSGHVRGLGRDRERARVDAARVEQVADQAPHVAGLLDDDAVELAHLGRIERRRVFQQRHRRASYGSQRLA